MATDRNHVVVVAIDFGTTYSGYAFSFRKDFALNKASHLTEISAKNWLSGDLQSDKTPTTLLLDRNKKFVSFGYEAETEYGRMSEEEREQHYYFRRFKMMLYDKDGKLVSLSQRLFNNALVKMFAFKVEGHTKLLCYRPLVFLI